MFLVQCIRCRAWSHRYHFTLLSRQDIEQFVCKWCSDYFKYWKNFDHVSPNKCTVRECLVIIAKLSNATTYKQTKNLRVKHVNYFLILISFLNYVGFFFRRTVGTKLKQLQNYNL